MRRRAGTRGWRATALAVAGVVVLTSSCTDEPDPVPVAGVERVQPVRSATSWRPAPRLIDGYRVLATAGPGGFALHTEGGTRDFLAGVNVPSTTPGHFPGELAISAQHYRGWFPAMARLGIRVLRVYTIHPPAFYTELARYNQANADQPLYLMHGVYLPDESYVPKQNLYDDEVTRAMSAEVSDVVAAVHGTLRREPRRGRASGEWVTDVSPWLLSWLAGVEWDAAALLATDQARAGTPAYRGRFFRATDDATPSESWIAARLDELATAQAGHGISVPIALVNWPTTDPLRHPDEPLEQEDLHGLDANHVLPTAAWPGGTFASYHAYPYYPDFQRHEPALQAYRLDGAPDPYAGYLSALRDHHAPHMPTMVTEFGVPSSIGSAHAGPLGRDQGGHSEQQAMRIDADLLRRIRRLGLAGGLVFAWSDEWFKFTWNTIEHQQPGERRPLWHDQLTNEQHFGIVATDPAGIQPAQNLPLVDGGGLSGVELRVDESYVLLDVRFVTGPAPVTIGVNAVPGVSGPPPPGSSDGDADHAVRIDPAAGTGQVWLRAELDPVQLDYRGPGMQHRPTPQHGWIPFQLIINRPLVVPTTGQRLPAELQNTGELRRGSWDPADPGYDSRSTWQQHGDRLLVRIPWAMLGFGDPSSRTVVIPSADGTARTEQRDGLGITVQVGGRPAAAGTLTWETWNAVRYNQRLKAGAEVLAAALAETGG